MPCELIHVVRDAGEETMRREQLPHQFFTYRSVGRRRIRTARESRVDEKLRHTDVVLQRETEQSTFLFRRHPHNVSVLTSTQNTAPTLGHPVRVSALHVINHARRGVCWAGLPAARCGLSVLHGAIRASLRAVKSCGVNVHPEIAIRQLTDVSSSRRKPSGVVSRAQLLIRRPLATAR